MTSSSPCVGAGWRPQLALAIERRSALGITEVMAEDIDPRSPPPALRVLRERGVDVIPHGVSLSLGSVDEPDSGTLAHLDALARALGSPFVSEHICFTHAGGVDSGHLLPLPRTEAAVDCFARNFAIAQSRVSVPIVLENVAALVAWPGDAYDEVDFTKAILDATGAGLLLDLANLHANAVNYHFDATAALDRLPLERVAYAHVAGGRAVDGFYHDTHRHAVPPAVLDLVEEMHARVGAKPVVVERDGDYAHPDEWNAELDAVTRAADRGMVRWKERHADARS